MSAQRASAPVRLARLAAAAALVVVAALVFARLAGRRGGSPPAPAAPPPEGRVVDLKERVWHREYKDGRPVIDIRGDRFFRGPDERNHLAGAVEIVNLGSAGETVSRLTADEVTYEPGSLRFTVAGRVRVEAGGAVLEGEAFAYDKATGVFATAGGGRFSSKGIEGRAPEIAYSEGDGRVRLGGGFEAAIAEAETGGRPLAVSGRALVYDRADRRGRVEGRATLSGAGFQAAAPALAFVAAEDESGLESADLEGGAKVVLAGAAGRTGESGEMAADRIAAVFSREGPGLSLQASGPTRLAFRFASDGAESVQAGALLLSFDPVNGQWTWIASGGIEAEFAEAGRVLRRLGGSEAVYDGSRTLRVSGPPASPASADSAEARIEAPSILLSPGTGDVLAAGGVTGVFRPAEGRTVGFFSPAEDVSFSCGALDSRAEARVFLLTGNVLIRQGTETLRADKVELAGDRGDMSGGGGVTATLFEAGTGEAGARTIEIGGREMAYSRHDRTLTLTSEAHIRLPEARLDAGRVSAVIGRDGRTVDSLEAGQAVSVSKGPYKGRAAAASYQAASRRITLTGRPVLTDGKGGSARGGKLTFDLADDKIFIENEGSGRATTVVRS